VTPPTDDPEAIRRILATTEALLLDFDGPVCSVFAGFPAPVVAGQLRDTLTERTRSALPEEVRISPDPFDVLFYAAELGLDEAHYIDAAFRAHEVEAVQSAEPTTGAHELITAWKSTGRPLAIVSNNSAAAVETYLNLHGLGSFVDVVSARSDSDITELKPAPYLVTTATKTLDIFGPFCTLLGDSMTDIAAAQAANVRAVAYANKPGKVEGFEHTNAVLIITGIPLLVSAIRQSSC
jgi:beta-phosphoglucomutase-like phosphatase (HAD superfamily)